jgi:hypothetical protein
MWNKATMTTKEKDAMVTIIDENNNKQHHSIATWNNDNICTDH